MSIRIEIPKDQWIDEIRAGGRCNFRAIHFTESRRAGAGAEFEARGIDAAQSVGGRKLDLDVAFQDGALGEARIREMKRDVEGIRIDRNKTELALVEDPAAREFQQMRVGRYVGNISCVRRGSGNANTVGVFSGRVVDRNEKFVGIEVSESRGELIGACVDGIPDSGHRSETFLRVEFWLPILGGGLVFEGGKDLKGVGSSRMRMSRIPLTIKPRGDRKREYKAEEQ